MSPVTWPKVLLAIRFWSSSAPNYLLQWPQITKPNSTPSSIVRSKLSSDKPCKSINNMRVRQFNSLRIHSFAFYPFWINSIQISHLTRVNFDRYTVIYVGQFNNKLENNTNHTYKQLRSIIKSISICNAIQLIESRWFTCQPSLFICCL